MYPLSFELECTDLPGLEYEDINDLRLGIQQNKEVVMDTPADSILAFFRIFLTVKQDPVSCLPRFSGAFVQGKPGEQFIYLVWGSRAHSGEWTTVRRAKFALSDLNWDELAELQQTGRPLHVRIVMTDRKGEPLAATIPPENIFWS